MFLHLGQSRWERIKELPNFYYRAPFASQFIPTATIKLDLRKGYEVIFPL